MRIRDLAPILLSAAVVVFAAACFTLLPNLNIRVVDRPAVRIRIANQTASDFQDVSIHRRAYGPLSRGAVSRYYAFAGVYEDASIQAETANGSLSCDPLDFEGESYLPAGSYTYTLRSDAHYPSALAMVVQRD